MKPVSNVKITCLAERKPRQRAIWVIGHDLGFSGRAWIVSETPPAFGTDDNATVFRIQWEE